MDLLVNIFDTFGVFWVFIIVSMIFILLISFFRR